MCVYLFNFLDKKYISKMSLWNLFSDFITIIPDTLFNINFFLSKHKWAKH